MKRKLTLLMLSLAAASLVVAAEDNKPNTQPEAPPPSDAPAPAKPDPAKTEPVVPEPAKPDPAVPEPVKTEPAVPEPAKPEPAKPEPTVPEPAKIEPAKPNPAVPEPVKTEPVVPEPAKPEPAKPEPTVPEPVKTEPAKIEPAVPEPTKAEPAKSEPVQVTPVKTEPETTQPAVPTANPASVPAPSASAPAATRNGGNGDGAEVVPLIVIDEVPLTDAIKNLARQANLNFQFDPKVTPIGPDGKPAPQPNLSLRWENVTAQEALNAVLENYSLVLVRDTKSKIARITIKDPKAEEPLVTKIIQLKYADPTNIISVVKATLTARSQVIADTRTKQLIVNTTEKETDNLDNTIAKLDTATKQVLIEAKFVETSKNPSTIKGIDWSGTFEAQNFKFGNGRPDLTPTKNTSLDGVDAPNTATYINGLFTGNGGILANTHNGFSPATAFLNADGVSAVLSFLNKDNDTEIVSTPRAVTLDNQPAVLSVTKAFPIFKITPGSANSPAGADVVYTNLGTILTVTPRIAANNNVFLRVIPEVSDIAGVDKQTLDGKVNTANIYSIRRMDTSVMIPSGHTLVMGGMISDSHTKGMSKVPILGDAPLLGSLFRHQKKERQKLNLIAFITPTVVDDGTYQPNSFGSDFMKTKYPADQPDEKESAWNSAKPYDWTKPFDGKTK